MKGQKLWTRAATEADSAELTAFYDREGLTPPAALPGGRIGKVAGTIVAHITWSVDERTLLIQHIYVARDLRRKRVALWMLDEVEKLAAGMHCEWIAVESQCPLREYFVKRGFGDLGDRMARAVRNPMT